jgi:hypothetical protein
MVMHRCPDTSTPFHRYCRVDRPEIPHVRCGVTQLSPAERAVVQIVQLLVTECIQIVSTVDQTYVAWPPRWIWDDIIKVDRILNTILRSSLVFSEN